MKTKIRKGDQVLVIAGKNRGSRGKVLRMLPASGKALVEGVNMIKRHTKPNPQRNIKGGILQRESTIHLSNVMPIDPKTKKPTRVGVRVLGDGGKQRVARRSGEALDK